MERIISNRKSAFRTQCLKYLRYVLNDHFVLFLLVFMGFLAIQYQEFLKSVGQGDLLGYLIIALVSAFLLPMGRLALYLEKPDSYFLLVSEEELLSVLKGQVRRSLILWASIQSLLLLLVLPIWLKIGLSWPLFLLLEIGLVLAKGAIFYSRSRRVLGMERLKWETAIQYEEKRKQAILRFFSLFTNVKGVSNHVKRRAYLDPLLSLLPKKTAYTWTHLYARSYLRNGDLFSLTLRLLILAMLLIIGIQGDLLVSGGILFVNYLLLFQLFGLYSAFDYQVMTALFPLDKKEKKTGLTRVLRGIYGLVFLVEALSLALTFQSLTVWASLIIGSLFYLFVYMPFKLNGLVDE